MIDLVPANALDRYGRLRPRKKRPPLGAAPMSVGMGCALHKATDAASGAGAWSPNTEGGIYLWLAGDQGITLNGSNVSAWADQSGNSRNFTQGTGTLQPAYNNPGLNGLPTVKGAAAGKYLTFAGGIDGNDMDAFVVFKVNTSVDAGVFSAASAVNNSAPFFLLQHNNTNSVIRTLYGNAYDNNGAIATGVALCAECSISGTTKTLYLNGVQGSQVTRTAANTNTNMFVCAGFPTYSDADIGEVLVFDHNLNGTARTNATNYLRGRWGFS